MLFFGVHRSFTILEPSGKGWPLPGMPTLYASIMVELATITLSTSSVRAEETTLQSSYPLKPENAIPLGDSSEYLSCALTAEPLSPASTAVAIAIVLLHFIGDPFLARQRRIALENELKICNVADGLRALWSLNRLSWERPRRLIGVCDFRLLCGRCQL